MLTNDQCVQKSTDHEESVLHQHKTICLLQPVNIS